MASSSSSSSCGACKFLRRKCVEGCVFAPHFSYEQGAIHFSAVHKVFGASNVSKLLLHLPVNRRSEAAATVSFEAQARMRDPVYGCVAYVYALQQQVARLQEEVECLSTHLSCTLNNSSSSSSSSSCCTDQLITNHRITPQITFDTTCTETYQNIVPIDLYDYYCANAVSIVSTDSSTTDERMQVMNVDELHPLYREAMDRLERSLLDDVDVIVDYNEADHDLISSMGCDDGFAFDVLENF